jgi:hypothetical protein
MAQMGEGAYNRIYERASNIKPPPADGFAYHLFSAYITLVWPSKGVFYYFF